MKEEVHAKSSVDGHTLEHLFACFPDDDIVSDMVLVGEVLELRHKLVEERVAGVGCSMDSLCYIATALGWMGVPDKIGEALSDIIVVCTRQTRQCRALLDGLGDVVEMEEHGGGDVARDMICRLSIILGMTTKHFTC